MSTVEIPKKWDHEADVIVVGGGTAGLPAGIIVAESGQKATILEVSPRCGGSFSMIAGAVQFAGTDEQKAAGIDDSPDILYDDLVNIAGADPGMARAVADNQLEAYRMLEDGGMKWPGFVESPGHSRLRGLGWIAGYGPQLVKIFEDRARKDGVEILTHHRATRLITDPATGRVIGVKIDIKGGVKNFKAKRAVIITTGGFGHNREMVDEYAPEMVDCPPRMPVSHQGDGIKMGMAVGADLKHMGISVAASWPVCVETHSEAIWPVWWGGIMVNVDGKRFHDESSKEAFYGPMTESGMRQPGGVYWVIFDDNVMNNIGKGTAEDTKRNQAHIRSTEKCKRYKGNTIEELAKSAGIDAKGLKETVEKYNSDIDSVGYDTVLGRKYQIGPYRAIVKLDKPPFTAIKCVTCITSMKGGLKINGRGQVLNPYNEVIPGLYAAGEVIGGLWPKTYLLGVMTSSAMAQGIVAARNAVKEPAWS